MLFGRQIMELLPVMVRDRPFMAVALAVGIRALRRRPVLAWRYAWRHLPKMARASRVRKPLPDLPVIAAFGSLMDYSQYSWIRDRLQVVPMMWDQKENYRSNGFILAFIFNVPMADVARRPASARRRSTPFPLAQLRLSERPARKARRHHADERILLGSDPPEDAELSEDPMPNIRAAQSGHVFSPEFGGMTANVEFEALTGFSNAFPALWQHSLSAVYPQRRSVACNLLPRRGLCGPRAASVQRLVLEPQRGLQGFRLRRVPHRRDHAAMEKRGIFASDDSA
jgi:hypothetical protein